MNNNYIYFDENGVLYELSGTTGLPLLEKIPTITTTTTTSPPPYVSYTLEAPTFSTPEDPTYYVIMGSSSDYWSTGRTLSYMSAYTYLSFERPLDNDDMFKVILSGSSTSFKILLNGDKELAFNEYGTGLGVDIGSGEELYLVDVDSESYYIQSARGKLYQESLFGYGVKIGSPGQYDASVFVFYKIN